MVKLDVFIWYRERYYEGIRIYSVRKVLSLDYYRVISIVGKYNRIEKGCFDNSKFLCRMGRGEEIFYFRVFINNDVYYSY